MKNIFVAGALLLTTALSAQDYNYTIDLNNVENDQLFVELNNIEFKGEELIYQFPKTIPGTYATEDYGKYIESFTALDSKGQKLDVKQVKNNSFVISNANDIKSINYRVNDTWDSGEKKDPIFEPAGTNWDKDLNYVLNNSGVFGYFLGTENHKINVEFTKPDNMFGMSVLPNSVNDSKTQVFTAESYHQLVDCPIIFAEPDTTNFKVANTDVTIAVYAEAGGKHSKKIYSEIKTSMDAIADFVGTLPVDNYTFLIYLKNKHQLGRQLENGLSLSMLKELKSIGGVGALEHGNSSLYYLLDMGDAKLNGPLEQLGYMSTIKSVAIHEFMHIFTPLNLHSEHIGDFNYADPQMSKHLWLYEGITEYFAGLIQVQGGIITEKEYFEDVMAPKIKYARKFKDDKMTFTEMSENVLEKKYHKHYMQVYQRGAVMGLLLDIEIMKLTNNEKTLKDVIVKLSNKYGPNKSFSEESFISEFVSEVHPDLQNFFDKYVQGHEPLPIDEQLSYIGWEYKLEQNVEQPVMPWQHKGIKVENSMNNRITGTSKVLSIKEEVETVLMVGDEINFNDIKEAFKDTNGDWKKEGSTVTFTIIRNGKKQDITTTVKSRMVVKKDYIAVRSNPSNSAITNFAVWIGKSNTIN